LNGSKADETLVGPAIPDLTIKGNDGDDCLVAGSGATKLLGGNGNDRLWSISPSNRMWGGPGNDMFYCIAGGKVMDLYSDARERDVTNGGCTIIHPK
jgi:Ca2+-binding RTX toxin-like protein